MSKISLQNLANLSNDATATAAINNNNALIREAFEKAVFRTNEAPNYMLGDLDMNSNNLLNLPAPYSPSSPLRLQDLADFNDLGTIYAIPPGGTTGQVLEKDSSGDYDVSWHSLVNPLPTGGTVGQLMVKNSSTDYDIGWQNPSGWVSVLDYGASPSASASANVTAFQSALNSGKPVYVPAGTYNLNATINILLTNTIFYGDGPGKSILRSSSANTSLINVAANLGNIVIHDLGLTRSVTATSGGTGINCAGYLDTSNFYNLEIQKQYVGVILSSTGYSNFSNSFIHDNLWDGVELTNTAANGNLQWYLNNILVQGNDGRGLIVIAVLGAAQVTLGDWTGVRTFANSSFGAAFVGLASVPINGVRIKNCFFGGDGNSEIFLDTYGGQHQIQTSFVELAGTGATGSNSFHTAPSGVGCGIEINPHNTDVHILGTVIAGNKSHGVSSLATVYTDIQSCAVFNGFAYGVALVDGAKSSLSCCYFANNTTGNVFYSANSSSVIAVGNFPTAINNSVFATLTVTGAATIGTTLNVTGNGILAATFGNGTAPSAIIVSGSSSGTGGGSGMVFQLGGVDQVRIGNYSKMVTGGAYDATPVIYFAAPGKFYIGGDSINLNYLSTVSTNATSGAVVINGTGGLGVGGNVNVGGTLGVTGATTLSAALTYGGVTLSNAVTGTGNMVLSASPTLSGTVSGNLTFSGTHTLSSALTYGGVTLSNAVTGTGNMVLSASPTHTGTAAFAAITASGVLAVSNTTSSTSTTTGSATFAGGIGVVGQVSANTFLVGLTDPANGWSFDGTAGGFNLATSTSKNFPLGSGLVLVRDGTVLGSTALFLIGAGQALLLGQSTGSLFVAGSPGAGKIGVEYSGATYYRITNNYGSTVNLTVVNFRAGAS